MKIILYTEPTEINTKDVTDLRFIINSIRTLNLIVTSTVSISFENLFIILPDGVMLNQLNGALRTRDSILLCNNLELLKLAKLSKIVEIITNADSLKPKKAYTPNLKSRSDVSFFKVTFKASLDHWLSHKLDVKVKPDDII